MLSVQEFKTAYNVNRSAYARMKKDVSDSLNLDTPLTIQLDGKNWIFASEAIFNEFVKIAGNKVKPNQETAITVSSQVMPLDLTVSPSTDNDDRYALSVDNRQQNSDITQANNEVIEDVLTVAERLIQGMQGYRQNLENQTDVSRNQVTGLKLKQFELAAELELTQESEARYNVQQRAVNTDLGKYSGNVVSLSDRLKKRVQQSS